MLIACWSAKGGSGTTVVAASLALLLGRSASAGGAVLADLGGDAAAALGLVEPPGPGLAGWLSAGPEVPADALARLEVPADASLRLLPRGQGALDEARADVLVALLRAVPHPVVADCGSDPTGVSLAVASSATRSILVTRPCFLALRRAQQARLRPSEVVLVTEPGRALSRRDVEDCVGAPVVAEVALDPAVARAVDAGLLVARLPRSLARELSRAA